MSKLVVYYQEKVVGALEFDRDERLSFRYDKSWLTFKDRFPLAIALALDDKVYGHLDTKAFFENLLPEGEIKELLESHGKYSIKSEFGFLQEFGGDCAGAFNVLPEQIKTPKTVKPRKELKFDLITKYLDQKKSLTDAILNQEGGKFSLAGAQDKFTVILEKNKIYLPLDGSPTTHIIKPRVRHFNSTQDTPYNEYLCMKLAAAVGLNTPAVDIIEGKYPLFVVERFDRRQTRAGVLRIHQQDFCQAQGITSLKKYESDGGPTFADNYFLVKAHSSAPIPDLNQLLKWLVFNLIIGNNDSHSKNLAFLQSKDGIRLAPFYDLLSTSIYKDIGKNFAFKIGVQSFWFKLNKRHFDKLSGQVELRDDIIPKIATKLLLEIEKHYSPLLEGFTERFSGVKTGQILQQEIQKRVGYFRKIFE